MLLVGVNVAVAKILSEAMPVALVAGLRCILACAVLLPLMLARGERVRAGRVMLANLFLQALFGSVLYNAALLGGLRLTTALEGGLVLATIPAVVAIGAALLLREGLTGRGLAAAGLAAGGMAAVVLARAGEGGGGSVAVHLTGNALVFAAVLGEAAYVLLARRAAGALPVVTAALLMQAFSAALFLPFWLPDAAQAARLADPWLLGLLVFHTLTSSVICLLLWYAGLRRVPAGQAGVFTALLPIGAVLTAVTFLGEAITVAHGVGFALLLGSIGLATWPGRKVR